MRIRTLPLSLTLGAMALSALTACSGGASDPPGAGGSQGASEGAAVDDAGLSPAVTGTGGNASGGAAPPTEPPTTEPPSAVDIRTVDLANATWLYSVGGFDLPVEVKLVNGEASSDGDGVPVTYSLGDVVYGDVDGDGDADAVARINRAQSMGSQGLWYTWLAEGPDAVQLKYPVAQTGRCSTFVESVVISDGGISLTEYLRIPGLDDAIPCSDPGTGLKKRTITIHTEGSDTWPVQTEPVAAWGGLCPGPRWPDTGPGLVDLWAAPSKTAATAAAAAPDGGAVFEQKDAALTQRDGWSLVGFRVFGVESDVGGTDMACAWALK